MPTLKYRILLIICLLPLLHVQAQFVNYGTDPARYKWNYVDLPHYRLIFPQGTDSMAYKYALYLENIYPHIQKSITTPVKRTFPVVLHPGTMQANGMVAWAPRRMELMTTPSSRVHAQSWDKHLVMHESRHVIQTSKLMSGMFNPLYYIIGEQAAGLSSFFSTRWFFEGDAVGAETAMSSSGRGRLPEFNMSYRAQMYSGEFYSFDKWYLGSYKDYTGDFYALGYDLTSYTKYKHGADIWDKITTRYVNRFFHLPPFPKAIKYHTGESVDELFRGTFSFLKEEWDSLDIKNDQPVYLSPDAGRYTSYRYPQAWNDSTIIAVKSSLHDINALVKIINGREEHLAYIGSINSRIVLNKDRVYWSENVSGLRWTHENYSEIKEYSLNTGKITNLTPRQRYLAPAINSKGDMLAASRYTPEGLNQIVLMTSFEGNEIRRFPTPGNAFVKELTFADNDNSIIAFAVNDEGLLILRVNTTSGEWTELLPPTSANLTSPVWHEGKLYFESGLDGTNNLYSLEPETGKTEKITSARFGAFNPAFSTDSKKIVYADYQAKGYRIAALPVDSLKPESADLNTPYRFRLAEAIAGQEQFNIDTVTLELVPFHPKPYRKALHLFNVHSWAPFYYDIADVINASSDDLTTLLKPGITVLSQNALNSAITQVGWYYKDSHHHGKLSFAYMGWFPVIHLDMDYGGKAFNLEWKKNEENKDVTSGYISERNMLEAKVQAYLPFNLSRNQYIRGIQPSVTWYFTNNRYQQYESRKSKDFQYILSELRFYNYRRMAHRDILPRWGYQIRLQYLATPFDSENFGNLYAGRLTTYWPGLIRNHSLMLRFGYQYQNIDDKRLYVPKRLLETPRGYNYLTQSRQHIALKADYAFSIACPDLSIGTLAYIRRVRSNLFYDYTRNQSHKKNGWTTQSAAGLDLLLDWNVIRMSYPLSLGARFIQPIDYGNFQVEALFSMSF